MNKNKPVILTTGYDQTSLVCPNCEHCFMHQCKVEVFDRNGEDAEKGMHVTIDYDNGVDIDSSIKNNPSRRRSGIKVYFTCELCSTPDNGPYHELNIVQHKGIEYVYWSTNNNE